MQASENALVLNGLVIRGLVSGSQLATACQLEPRIVGNQLAALIQTGYAAHRDGPLSGYLPTPEGIRRWQELQATELGASEPHLALRIFATFNPINAEFKQLCADVQMGGTQSVLVTSGAATHRLEMVHTKAHTFISHMSIFAPRWQIYAVRLDGAYEKVREGDWGLLTKPLAESYHDIWMELHHDILVTLQVQRAEGDH